MNAADWRALRRLEQSACRLGLELDQSTYDSTRLALVPTKDGLPPFVRRTELWSGDVDDLESFIGGWEKAVMYLIMLGVTSHEAIDNAEAQIRQQWTVDKLKQ